MIKQIINLSFKTILILSLIILFINTNTVLQKETNSISSFSNERTLKSCSQEKNLSSVSIEVIEVPRSEYTDALILWFQLMHPSDVDNPFNGSPNTFSI